VIPSQKDNAHFWPVETNCALSRSWTTNKLFYLPAHSSTSRKQCIATLRNFACREPGQQNCSFYRPSLAYYICMASAW
jgi:hypothetical protein